MPKPYIINVEVEEIALGLVLRRLNAMPGIVALHMDFDFERKAIDQEASADRPRRGRPPLKAAEDGPKKRGRPLKNANAARKKGHGLFERTGAEVLLDAMKHGRVMAVGDMRDIFSADGRSPSSVNSIIHKLQVAGLIESTDRNQWRLTRKATPKPKPKPKPKSPAKTQTKSAAKANGDANQVAQAPADQ